MGWIVTCDLGHNRHSWFHYGICWTSFHCSLSDIQLLPLAQDDASANLPVSTGPLSLVVVTSQSLTFFPFFPLVTMSCRSHCRYAMASWSLGIVANFSAMMSSMSSVTPFGVLGSAFTTSDFRQMLAHFRQRHCFRWVNLISLMFGVRAFQKLEKQSRIVGFSRMEMEVLQGHCQGEPALSSDLVLLGRQLIGVIWPLQEISDGLSQR